MKIPNNRMYPYPIFAQSYSDYKDNVINAEFEISHNGVDANIAVKTKITNRFILEQLSSGKFGLFCHIECVATRYRDCREITFPFINNKAVFVIDANSINRNTELVLLVMAKEDVNIVGTEDMHSFFCNTNISFPQNAIVGFSDSYDIYVCKRFGVNQKPSSIVSYVKSKGEYKKYHLDGDQIIIALPEKDYESYRRLNGSFERTKQALFVEPTLAYVAEKVKSDEDGIYVNKEWYRVIENALVKKGFLSGFAGDDFKEAESHEIAARLLENSFSDSLSELNNILSVMN